MENKIKDIEGRLDNLETALYEIKKHLEINDVIPRIKEPESKRKSAEEEVMSAFDFDRVADVMQTLNWTWHTSCGPGSTGLDQVPSADDIKKEARGLIQRCWKGLDESAPDEYSSKEYEASSGGLHVRAFEDSDGDVFLDLKFVLEEYRYEPY